jgi:hypothetical protein
MTMVATFMLASLVHLPADNARVLRHAGCDPAPMSAGCMFSAVEVAVLRGTVAL